MAGETRTWTVCMATDITEQCRPRPLHCEGWQTRAKLIHSQAQWGTQACTLPPIQIATINDVTVPLLLDPGCDVSVIINIDLIDPKDITKRTVTIVYANKNYLLQCKIIVKIRVWTPCMTDTIEAACLDKPIISLIRGNLFTKLITPCTQVPAAKLLPAHPECKKNAATESNLSEICQLST